jgi:hypothetical protein
LYLIPKLWIAENGVVTQSRYATPEVYVLFFGALATCSWTLMHKYKERYVIISNILFIFFNGVWFIIAKVLLQYNQDSGRSSLAFLLDVPLGNVNKYNSMILQTK